MRHSEASHASVVVIYRTDEATLLIEDDGRGFDIEQIYKESDTSLGLMGAKERSILIGGVLNVESAPGSGTTIQVKIPVKKVENANLK